ncbi:MAG: hypothetical protein J6T63_08040 [Bacteroidales bacterium]|nr:hypothetical protein [Bacteroidales bacterium]
MKRLFSILVLCLAMVSAFAQFTIEPTKFGKEFAPQLSYTGDMRKDGASMQKEFLAFWQSDTLTSKQRDSFIRTINKLQSKGCKPYPDFVRYTDVLMMFKRRGYDYGQFEIFEKKLNAMVSAGRQVRVNEISEFLQNFNVFLSKGIVANNTRTKWTVSKLDFLITYENEKFLIKFDNVDLIGYQDRDSLKLYSTSGVLNPLAKTWEGTGGVLGWERVGYPLDSMSVTLNKYNINMTDIMLKADSVVFRNKYYFTQDLMGDLLDKAQNGDKPYKSSYPRFTSYSQDFDIKKILRDVDYRGGLSVRGRNFIGSGVDDNKAEIRIVKNDSVSFSAYANAFVFDPEKIAADNCEIVLRLARDSIYHPSVSIRYTVVKRKIEKETEQQKGGRNRKQEKQYDYVDNGFLEIIRMKEGLSNINFVDTYHQLSMDFTSMKWIVDKPIIDIATVNTQGTPSEVLFESADYYSYEKYRALKKRDARNPLEVIQSVVSYVGGYPEFTLADLVNYMKVDRDQALQLVYALTYKGYISYDEQTEQIKVHDETWRFLAAHRGDSDSDVIVFYSKVNSDSGVKVDKETRNVVTNSVGSENVTNAKLSLTNFEIKMFGVPSVHLSDSQNVTVYPKNGDLVIHKNRNFMFDGLLQAGQFYMYGSGFRFDYGLFKIEVPNCDSMKMVALTTPDMNFLDQNGDPKPAIVRNMIEGLSGEFYIDYPSNKSGFADYDEYPKLVSTKDSYVYYDSKKIYSGIYDRKNFYFKVDPFVIDSIEGYSKENIHFDGVLVSGDILPDLKETLVVRKSDWSLGFEYKTPASGIPIYKGKATFKNDIDLSNKGLRADGTIAYMNTTFSDAYVTLFPDEMEGHSKKMKMEARKSPVPFPKVDGVENTLRWEVSKDKFHVDKDTSNFVMYDGKAHLDGNLVITSAGLHGNGTTYIDKAFLVSEDFVYKKDEFDADTADFNIYNNNIADIDFFGERQKSHIDFINRIGDFSSNDTLAPQDFKKNKYKCVSDRTIWNMDKDELSFSTKQEVLDQIKNIDVETEWEKWESAFMGSSKFTSYMPGQDELAFHAPEAVYNYKQNIIKAKGVGLVRVADAIIYPSEDMIIRENAVMDTLRNAKITANSTSERYKFYNATVKIKGRRDYTGDALYDYINDTKEPQTIHFTDIGVRDGETRAHGEIPEPDNFMLTRYFRYQGKVNVYAGKDTLEYEGGAKPIYQCDTSMQWFKFKAFVSSEDAYIPIAKDLKSINDRPLRTSVLFGNSKVYPAFLIKRSNSADETLFDVNGYIHYVVDSGKYEIASKEKLYEPNLPGNYMSIDASTCNIKGEGKFDFSKNFDAKVFKLNSYGTFSYNVETDTTEFNTTMFINMPMPNAAYEHLAKVLKAASTEAVDEYDENYQVALKQFLDTAEYSKYMTSVSFGNYNKIPKMLTEDKVIITGVKLVYDRKSQKKGMVYGGPIGIVSFGKHRVLRQVEGYIRIIKARSSASEVFEMLISIGEKKFFYFSTDGKYVKTSSDEGDGVNKYRSIISESKEKYTDNYNVILEGNADKNAFESDMNRKFQNKEPEY